MATAPAARRRRRPVIRSITEVPEELVDEMIVEMAGRMSGTPEARRTRGLSFAFHVAEMSIEPACYRVGARGKVTLQRGDVESADFVFTATAEEFDLVLSGRRTPVVALVRRRISMRGSLAHIRQLLRMMHAVESAYMAARADIMERYADVYDFRV